MLFPEISAGSCLAGIVPTRWIVWLSVLMVAAMAMPTSRAVSVGSGNLSLGDQVWLDTNGNGIKDATEVGINGVAVNLVTSGDVVIGVTVTANLGGVDGRYLFEQMDPGGYFVVIFPPAHATNSSPAGVTDINDNGEDDDDNGIQPAPGGGIVSPLINLAAGTEPTGEDGDNNTDLTVDFGLVPNSPLGSIGNFVFRDNNNDGILGSGESGVDGITVILVKDSLPVATNVTAAGGVYGFFNLPAGTNYLVRVLPPAGLEYNSTPTPGGNNRDNASQTTFGGFVETASFSLAAGENRSDLDVGLAPSPTLGNLVFRDINNDGILNGTDAGVDGVTVVLQRDSSPVATNVTSGGGLYSFSNLVATGGYQVIVRPSTGLDLNSAPTPGGNDRDNGTQASPGGGITSAIFPLAIAEVRTNVDFGLVTPVHVGNLVFLDQNGDGIRNSGETGIPGVTLYLHSVSGGTTNAVPSATAVSNPAGPGAGYYAFLYQFPGDYVIVISNPPPTATNVTLSPVLVDNTVDDDSNAVQPVPGGVVFSPQFNLNPGSEPFDLFGGIKTYDASKDVGFLQNSDPASIGNLVFRDDNNDGILNNADAGVDGITVVLLRQGVPVATNVTSGGGLYQFSNLLAVSGYRVRVTPNSQLAGNSTPTPGGDSQDNGTQSSPGGFIFGSTISLLSGESRQDQDFGLIPLVHVGNLVFRDDNANGFKETAEPGIPGVTLYLHSVVGGVTNPVPVASRVSNPAGPGEGYYLFNFISPGDYVIIISNPPAGATNSALAFGPTDNGFDGDNNGFQAQPGGRVVSPLFTLNPGEELSDLYGSTKTYDHSKDFAFVPDSAIASLGSLVFADTNNDGLKGGSESGVDGVTVRLRRNGVVVGTTVTTGGGLYSFVNLVPGGTYVVEVTPPSNLPGSSTPTPGGNDADNGTQAALGGIISSGPITLAVNENRVDVDFGLIPYVHVGNLVYLDQNADGFFGAGDTGIPGVTVTLYSVVGGVTNATPVASTVSNPAGPGEGYFAFLYLSPGDYVMVISNPPSVATHVSPIVVSADNLVDSDNNAIQPSPGGVVYSPRFQLNPGSEGGDLFGGTKNYDFSKDFAFYPNAEPASVGDLVFGDLNDNGIKDSGETGLNGVTVMLSKNGTVIRTNTTTTGQYLFTNLPPGNAYQVRVMPPGNLPHNSTATPGGDDADNGTQTAPFGVVLSSTFDLAAGENRTAVDIGLSPLVHVGNLVFLDSNGNGFKEAGEPGIPGVTLHLLRVTGGVTNPVPVATRVSNPAGPGEGYFVFTYQTPGDYVLVISNAPAGAPDASPATLVDDLFDNDSNGTQSESGGAVFSVLFNLKPGEEFSDLFGGIKNWDNSKDFGFIPSVPSEPSRGSPLLVSALGTRSGRARSASAPPSGASANVGSGFTLVARNAGDHILIEAGLPAGYPTESVRVERQTDDGWLVVETQVDGTLESLPRWTDSEGDEGSRYRLVDGDAPETTRILAETAE